MPRKKKQRGRPARALPPSTDATPEQLVRALLALPADYDWEHVMSLARAEIIGKAVVEAWNRIVETPDGLLVDLIAETTEDICGFKPERHFVEQFLSRRAGQWPDAPHPTEEPPGGVLHTPAQVGGQEATGSGQGSTLSIGRKEERMDQGTAMEKVNGHLGRTLLNRRSTHFSSVNASKPVWWLNIPLRKFKDELHLLLVKENGGLIWLRIQGNTFPSPKDVFRIREDKNAIDLEISTMPQDYMTDVKSGGTNYNFTKHIEYEWGPEE